MSEKVLTGNGWSGFSLIGRRATQCDAYRVIDWGDGLLVIVCDGHGREGKRAAEFVCERLPHALAQLNFAHGRERHAIRAAFRAIDFMLELQCDGGTCVTIAHVTPGSLFLAWVGDSQAGVAKGRTIIQLSEDHVPDEPYERLRLETLGANVNRGRIVTRPGSTGIAVSRALGDIRYGELVSPEPDWKRLFPPRAARHLIVGTDGFWRVIDSAAIHSATVLAWLDPDDQPADRLLRQVHELGPCDNATAVVVDLRPFHSTSPLS